MKDGYTQVLNPDGSLEVLKGNDLVATGRYSPDDGLVKFDAQTVANNAITPDQLHARLGHAGTHVMRDTISAVEGIDVQGKLEAKLCKPCEAKLCEPCVLGKTTAANAPKSQTVEG